MDIFYERCAGLDVHKKTVVGCVRVPGKGKRKRCGETKTFSTMTGGIVGAIGVAGRSRCDACSDGIDGGLLAPGVRDFRRWL